MAELARKKKVGFNKIREFIETIRLFVGGHRNVTGLGCFVVLFCVGFFMQGQMGLYFNVAGLLIVVGGTFSAALISFRVKRLGIVYKVLRSSLKAREISPNEIIETLVDLSLKSKIQGLLSLEEDETETTVLFLRRALGYLVDGYPTQQIRDFLTTEIYYFKARREESERVLRTLAEICPSFGLVGSVAGLMSMLAGVGDTTTILKTIPVALTSTLYGVLFANFFFLPFASHIQERTDQETFLQKIILEGVVAIGSGYHPRVLENKLMSFLTPAERAKKLVSIERIREKFNARAEGGLVLPEESV